MNENERKFNKFQLKNLQNVINKQKERKRKEIIKIDTITSKPQFLEKISKIYTSLTSLMRNYSK